MAPMPLLLGCPSPAVACDGQVLHTPAPLPHWMEALPRLGSLQSCVSTFILSLSPHLQLNSQELEVALHAERSQRLNVCR